MPPARSFLLGLVLLLALSSAHAARDHLTLGMVLEPPHLDPTAGAAAAIKEVTYANLFEGLTRVTETGAVELLLAREVTVSEDALSYTFELHEGVTFHDGTPLTSADVVFSFERAMAEDSVNAQKQIFDPIESMETPDEHTVVIRLSQPTGAFLYHLGWGDAVIVSPETAADNRTNPVGTGPFRFRRWVSGDRVEIERYEDYRGEPAHLQSATFQFISDPSAAAAAMLAGDVDAFANFPAPELLAQFEADPRFTVVVGNTEGETILSINNAREPFDDIRVRRAISHAIDRRNIIDGAMFGYGTPIGSHFAPHHPAYVDLTERYPHDPDRARELLAEAGHPDGFSATLRLPPPSYARRGGEIVASQLAEVGIRLEIIPIEWAQWLEQVFRATDYDLTIVSHTEPMDIDIYARDEYYFNYRNPEFKTLIETLSATVDDAERYELLAEAQRMLAEDAVNGFLFQLAKHGVWRTEIEGLWHDSPIQANDLTRVRWRE